MSDIYVDLLSVKSLIVKIQDLSIVTYLLHDDITLMPLRCLHPAQISQMANQSFA